MRIILLFLSSVGIVAATGSWNGVAFTALNGLAQTSWNGTGISCASGGGNSVQLDTTAAEASPGTTGDFTISITVGNNANRILYVGVAKGGTGGTDTINGVSSSVNGAFTEVTTNGVSDGNWVNIQVWKLVNPSTGAHTITVDTSATAQYCGHAVSLYTVNTNSVNGTIAISSGTGTAPSATSTLGSGGMALGFLCTDSETGVSVTAGTQLLENEGVSSDIAQSTANRTGNGTITWATTSNGYAVAVVPVNATP